jgi:lysyl-tRNA synthetase class 1
MIWVDQIAEGIAERFAAEIKAGKPLIVRDEKTLSGRVHVGSLRGIVIHGLVAQVLQERGIDAKFLFELNDFDPMDGLPVYIDEKQYKQHMGKPLFSVPSSEPGHENYAMVFGDELKDVVGHLHLPIDWYTLKPLYEAGKFNDCIRDALNHAAEIRAIYKEVSGGGKPDDWFPLQVICEQCGRVGTTQVTSWDGNNSAVTYECKKNLVKWAEGCGHSGSINPFDGRAKLPWKVEWPAKWKVMGVHIEGCGKDHSAAGGSRQIGARITQEVFHYPEPFNIPYEFFNLAGKKMSASKGIGASAKEVSDLLPPTLVKLLMMRTIPNRPIDFDPEGNTIPNLFDEYDRLSDHYFKRHKEPDADFARTFRLAHLDPSKEPEDLWQMRFTVLSFAVQMPHLHLVEEAEKLKGTALTKTEKASLEERAHYVRQWLAGFAAAEFKYVIQKETPADMVLTDAQRSALSQLHVALQDAALPWDGPKIHEAIHKVKEEAGIAPKELFEPLYRIFLNRKSGPQVGWFLSTFPRPDVIARLASATMKA